MNEWTVLERLHTLLAVTDENRASLLPLCRAAADTICARMKDGADQTDPRLADAAAGIAYCRYLLRAAAEDADVTFFKAGDVTIHRADKSVQQHAFAVRDALLTPALPLLRDDGFLFRSV